MLGGISFDQQVGISVQSFNLHKCFLPGLYSSIRSVVLASIISKASQRLVVLCLVRSTNYRLSMCAHLVWLGVGKNKGKANSLQE